MYMPLSESFITNNSIEGTVFSVILPIPASTCISDTRSALPVILTVYHNVLVYNFCAYIIH